MAAVHYRYPRNDEERELLAAFHHERRVLAALQRVGVDNEAADARMDMRRVRKVQRRAIDHAIVRVAALAAEINDTMRPTDA